MPSRGGNRARRRDAEQFEVVGCSVRSQRRRAKPARVIESADNEFVSRPIRVLEHMAEVVAEEFFANVPGPAAEFHRGKSEIVANAAPGILRARFAAHDGAALFDAGDELGVGAVGGEEGIAEWDGDIEPGEVVDALGVGQSRFDFASVDVDAAEFDGIDADEDVVMEVRLQHAQVVHVPQQLSDGGLHVVALVWSAAAERKTVEAFGDEDAFLQPAKCPTFAHGEVADQRDAQCVIALSDGPFLARVGSFEEEFQRPKSDVLVDIAFHIVGASVNLVTGDELGLCLLDGVARVGQNLVQQLLIVG